MADSRQFDTSMPPFSSSALRVTSKELIQHMDISPDALLIVDREGTIVMVNEQAAALFGYSREELQQQRLEMLLPERLHAMHVAHREHYFATPRTRSMGSDSNCWDSTRMVLSFRWISVCAPCCWVTSHWPSGPFVI